IETSATHMEWFAGPKGLKFSEIGCRPPGVGTWDLYAAANEFDIYREWAMAVVHGKPSQAPSRRFAAGIIALRPDRDGVIAGYEGIEEVHRRIATITAGWQEREAEDEELDAHLGGNTVNLRLHARGDELFREDPELRAAHRERQDGLRHRQDFYRIRLEHALAAELVIANQKR